jgi:uncharacterized protein YndB with AHSA1/START domain
MNLAVHDIPDADFATLTAADTVRIERVLPGPIDRVWAYLTDGNLRRQWLAAGDMDLREGAPFELVWRNDELTDPPGRRPDGFDAEHRMQSTIVAVDAPHRLVFTWGRGAEVTFELAPQGKSVRLTITHRRLPDRETLLKVGAGWHAHLDVLATRMAGAMPAGPFWDDWSRLRDEYDRRIPG